MFKNYSYPSDTEEEKGLAYDLRQKYAEIVGKHIEDVAEKRKANDFYTWYMALKDLFTITNFKYSSDEVEKKYKDFCTKITFLANTYPAAWTGGGTQADKFKIDLALRELEEWIYEKMNEANMFGYKFADDEGL